VGRRIFLVAVTAFLLLGAACSGDDDDAASPTSTPSSSGATTTTAPPTKAVRIATYNVLHGLFCEASTDFCQAPDRATLLARQLEAAGCPDIVGLQEVGARQEAVFPATFGKICNGRYRIVWNPVNSPDREMVLTTLPVVDSGYLDIANFPWEAVWLRVRTEQGPVDFLTAHFASSSNNPPCDASRCPPVCADGIETNECHAHEVVDFFSKRDGAALTVVGGDLNAKRGSPTIRALEDAGFVDTWLASGNDECDAATGAGCTSERERPDNDLDGMDAPDGHYAERIDWVLARGSDNCTPAVDDAVTLGSEPADDPLNGLSWASDHAGVLSELRCE
jgi:hypothetical protein